jgi:hypothetical protein
MVMVSDATDTPIKKGVRIYELEIASDTPRFRNSAMQISPKQKMAWNAE